MHSTVVAAVGNHRNPVGERADFGGTERSGAERLVALEVGMAVHSA